MRLRLAMRLRDEPGDNPGQYIAHARRGHARVPGRDEPGGLASSTHQRTAALKNDSATVTLLQSFKGAEPITLDSRRRPAEQTSGFARVRSQYPVISPDSLARHQIQRICIQDHRQRGGQNGSQQALGPVILAKTRAESDDRCPRQQWLKIGRFSDAVTHQLRANQRQETGVRGTSGHANESGTRAQGSFTGQSDGTAHPVIAANDEDMTEVTLVRRC